MKLSATKGEVEHSNDPRKDRGRMFNVERRNDIGPSRLKPKNVDQPDRVCAGSSRDRYWLVDVRDSSARAVRRHIDNRDRLQRSKRHGPGLYRGDRATRLESRHAFGRLCVAQAWLCSVPALLRARFPATMPGRRACLRLDRAAAGYRPDPTSNSRPPIAPRSSTSLLFARK